MKGMISAFLAGLGLSASLRTAEACASRFPAGSSHAGKSRRSRPSKRRNVKVGFGRRCCDADRRTPAPWLPNVKGMRYQNGKLVSRHA